MVEDVPFRLTTTDLLCCQQRSMTSLLPLLREEVTARTEALPVKEPSRLKRVQNVIVPPSEEK